MNIFLPKSKNNRGMTYIELIVVMGIFSLLSSVTVFNYRKFQEKVDIKTLANEIALKLVELQKDSTSGKLPDAAKLAQAINPWKPSYGVHFDRSKPQIFYPFVDLDQSKSLTGSILSSSERLGVAGVTIANINTSISDLAVFYTDGTSKTALTDLGIVFTRPDSVAIFASTDPFTGTVSYAQVTLSSTQGVSAKIKVYASGRIEIK